MREIVIIAMVIVHDTLVRLRGLVAERPPGERRPPHTKIREKWYLLSPFLALGITEMKRVWSAWSP